MFGRITGLVTATALAGLLSSCGSGTESADGSIPADPGPGPGGAVISGQIRGAVVSGVQVSISGPRNSATTTDSTGAFRFEGLVGGSYTVAPTPSRAAHFAPASALVVVDGETPAASTDFSSYVPPQELGFSPPDIGSELWAWCWAGDNGSNLVLQSGGRGMLIDFMADLSGRGNHYFNYGATRAAYGEGVQIPASVRHSSYSTILPLIGMERWPSGDQWYNVVYYQASGMNAQADFYLVCAMINTQGRGVRELFGSDDVNNTRLDQGTGQFYCKIGGVERRIVSGGIPWGPLVLEFWRDQAGRMTVMANGVEVSDNVVWPGVFDVAGFGYNGAGTSHFDDYLLELVCCDALPPSGERDQIRDYLRQKWGLW